MLRIGGEKGFTLFFFTVFQFNFPLNKFSLYQSYDISFSIYIRENVILGFLFQLRVFFMPSTY